MLLGATKRKNKDSALPLEHCAQRSMARAAITHLLEAMEDMLKLQKKHNYIRNMGDQPRGPSYTDKTTP